MRERNKRSFVFDNLITNSDGVSLQSYSPQSAIKFESR